MQSMYISGAAPTSSDAWTDISNISVPAKVQTLEKIWIGHAPDPTLTGGTIASIRAAPVFRLTGSGLLEQSPHEYVLDGMQYILDTVATNFDAALLALSNVIQGYKVSIPVQVGGQIDAQMMLLDEVGFAGSGVVGFEFSDESPSGNNQMSEYVDVAGTTTADVFSTVGTLTVPQLDNAPSIIRELVIVCAPDMGTGAVSLRVSPVIRLTGSGIAEGGDHDFIGSWGYINHTLKGGTGVEGGAVSYKNIARIPVNIPINAGGSILVEHLFVGETPTASTVVVGVLYG